MPGRPRSNSRNRARRHAGALAVLALVSAACGGGGGGDLQPDQSPLVLAKAPAESGDQQSGAVGQPLAAELRVIVTRDGTPQANVTVAWSTSGGGLDPASGPTDASGIGTSRWTLGPDAGAQSAQAAVQGATGSPVSFSATAASDGSPPPPPPGPAPSTASVTLGNIFFRSDRNLTRNPAIDTVAVNGMVTWTWVGTGDTEHSVLSTGTTSFTSSATRAGSGTRYQFQFTQPGTYTYNCAVHGSQMTGRIVVR
jgi:plastocyanin